jgi:D-hexose-6-phosphate mutarotase
VGFVSLERWEMIEHHTKEGGHFKVGLSATSKHILLQVQNKYGDQAREALTVTEAEHIALLLLDYVDEIKTK